MKKIVLQNESFKRRILYSKVLEYHYIQIYRLGVFEKILKSNFGDEEFIGMSSYRFIFFENDSKVISTLK